jgi:hypothetical protein
LDSKNNIRLFCWIFLLLPLWGYAQTAEVNFTYGENDQFDGTLHFKFFYEPTKPDFGSSIGQFSTQTQGTNIQFIDLEYGSVRIILDRIQLDKKKHENQFQFVIPMKCFGAADGMSLYRSKAYQSEIANQQFLSSQDKTFDFRVTRNGSNYITINFGVISKDITDLQDWKCEEGTIRVTFNVSGILEEEEIRPNQDSLDFFAWKRNGLKGYSDYLTKYPDGQYAAEADRGMREIEQQLWDQAKRTNKISSYNDYLETMAPYPKYMRHKEDANDRISALQQNSEERKFWNARNTENTIAAYEAYLERYPEGTYERQAREGIVRLMPMGIEYQTNEAGFKEIKFSNVNNLRYKDISPDYGLTIDDSQLRSDTILRISYESQGLFRLFVEDDWGKSQEFSFSNELVATMALNQDSTLLQFSIDGGKKPYQIDLIDHLTGNAVYSISDIEDPSISIPIDTLRAKGIVGILRSEIRDKDQLQPQYPEGLVKIETIKTFGLNWIVILSILVGLAAIALVYILVKYLRNSAQET